MTPDPDVLDLDPDHMRRLGYDLVDRVVAHLTGLGGGPALATAAPGDLRDALGGPLPRDPAPVEEGLARLADVAVANQQHGDHPRYFARVAGPSSFPAILADWLVTGTQTVASSWVGGSGPTTVELVACDWLREALGLPAPMDGILLSGGSMANITGLLAARAAGGPGVAYLSDQTHSSIRRGLLAMGWDAADVRTLPSDEGLRLDAGTVRAAVVGDLAAGRRPAIVVATAGTTNTGAVDDLPGIADLRDEHGFWLHVDAAYGGPAAMTPTGRTVLTGLDRADSVVVDPHKWLFQPYDIACLLVRERGLLDRTFTMNPEYLADVQGDVARGEVTMHNRSLELTRRSRAFKLWLTFRTYGADVLAAAVQRGIALAEHAQRRVEADPRLEVVTPAQLGIVTFAATGATDEAHVSAASLITEDGYAAVSPTVLRGRSVFRLCTINPRTTEDDLTGTIARLADLVAAAVPGVR